jgi:hypothetical protein
MLAIIAFIVAVGAYFAMAVIAPLAERFAADRRPTVPEPLDWPPALLRARTFWATPAPLLARLPSAARQIPNTCGAPSEP